MCERERQTEREVCAVISRLSESVIQRGETEEKRKSMRIRKRFLIQITGV